MWSWYKMNDEELEQIAGGVTPNFIGKERPIIPITGEPGNGENAEFLFP